MRPGDPTLDALATSGPARDGLVALERGGTGPGALTPFEVLAEEPDAPALRTRLAAVPGVQAVLPVEPAGNKVVLDVLPRPDGPLRTGPPCASV